MQYTGLNAPELTPKQVYQQITQTMISAIKNAKGKMDVAWDKEFRDQKGYMLPASFGSKKAYRGINILMLKKGNPFTVYQNPYFLTAHQIAEKKGELIPNAPEFQVIYFTRLYKYQGKEKATDFTTYSKQKMMEHLISKGHKANQFDLLVEIVPILKNYTVFNGSAVKGIDFKLEELTPVQKAQLGYVSSSDPNQKQSKNPIAELIIKNFPKNSAKLEHGHKGASYSVKHDLVRMPSYNAFYKSQDYYSVLFHEMIHSTGHPKRLDRILGTPFRSPTYAKEELIAEFGAVFLSAQAGILWKTQQNHAKYLKNWQMALKFMGEDEKLLMRAASAAQKAVDYLLQVDTNNEPLFYKEIQEKLQEATLVPQKQIKKVVQALNSGVLKIPRTRKNAQKPLSKNTSRKSLAYKREQRKNKIFTLYDIPNKDLKTFLGDLEVKEKESLVVTLAGKRGSGKTRFAFRFINVLAQKYNVGHASMEEHPDTKLYWDKADEYFNKQTEQNLDTRDITSLNELDSLIKDNDIIVIDSFAKLKELDNKLEIDTHLRKKYDGKLFLIIFQQTADGKMRGGAKSGFDGDCIFFVEKATDYKLHHVYTDKNRYQNRNLEELKYNIHSGKLNPSSSQEVEF